MSKQVDFLVKLRDAHQMAADSINEFLESLPLPEAKSQEQKPAAVQETTFTILTFEPQQGAKIGEYSVAYRQQNVVDKWTQAESVLRQSNATINARYHGQDYQFSYWLYGEGKIYRQKLKQKA